MQLFLLDLSAVYVEVRDSLHCIFVSCTRLTLEAPKMARLLRTLPLLFLAQLKGAARQDLVDGCARAVACLQASP